MTIKRQTLTHTHTHTATCSAVVDTEEDLKKAQDQDSKLFGQTCEKVTCSPLVDLQL
jgi:hypothetical protein